MQKRVKFLNKLQLKADMARKKRHFLYRYLEEEETHKGDITLFNLVIYNLLFFLPLIALYMLSKWLATYIAPGLQTTEFAATSILMIPLSFLFFLVLIPYIRKRENIRGVRYALFGFLIVGIGMTIVPMLHGNYAILAFNSIFIANYMFLTFIYNPEVLGMDIDIRNWFRHYRQLAILALYVGIVIFYCMGFAWIYLQISADPVQQGFNVETGETPTYGTFFYYSLITFATVGYGDITPLTNAARALAVAEALIGMTINVVFIAILFVYISNFQEIVRKEKELEKRERKLERTVKKEEKFMKKIKRLLK